MNELFTFAQQYYCSPTLAAVFFYAYEITKSGSMEHGAPIWLSSMLAAGCGEIVSFFLYDFRTVKSNPQLLFQRIADSLLYQNYSGYKCKSISQRDWMLIFKTTKKTWFFCVVEPDFSSFAWTKIKFYAVTGRVSQKGTYFKNQRVKNLRTDNI